MRYAGAAHLATSHFAMGHITQSDSRMNRASTSLFLSDSTMVKYTQLCMAEANPLPADPT